MRVKRTATIKKRKSLPENPVKVECDIAIKGFEEEPAKEEPQEVYILDAQPEEPWEETEVSQGEMEEEEEEPPEAEDTTDQDDYDVGEPKRKKPKVKYDQVETTEGTMEFGPGPNSKGVWQYFLRDRKKQFGQCQVDGCGQILATPNSSTTVMRTHLFKKHNISLPSKIKVLAFQKC